MSNALQQFLRSRLDNTLAFLRDMVAINSGPANPTGILAAGNVVATQFAALGFEPEYVPARNPLSGSHPFLSRTAPDRLHGAARQAVCLVAHLDTVYSADEEERNDFQWKVDGERIYGPGTSDDKGGIAMIYAVLEALQTHDPQTFEQTDWVVALNAAEETMSPDFPGAVESHLPRNTRACLVFEGAHLADGGYAIPVARKGSTNMLLTVHGRGAHGGGRHPDGANAIVALSLLLPQIAALTDYSRDLTVNPGVISGGIIVNRVPAVAECQINMRAFDPALLETTRREILEITKQADAVRANSDGYACSAELTIVEETPAWPGGCQTQGLFEIWQSAARKCGSVISPERRGGVSDANVICHLAPTLDGLGPSGGNDHCSERSADGSKLPEYVEPESFVTLGEINVRALQRLLGD
jgi:glutamate carboxypeptidase